MHGGGNPCAGGQRFSVLHHLGTVERIRGGGEMPQRGRRRLGAGVPLRSGSNGRIQAGAGGCDGVRQLLDEQPERSGERADGRLSASELARPVPARRGFWPPPPFNEKTITSVTLLICRHLKCYSKCYKVLHVALGL